MSLNCPFITMKETIQKLIKTDLGDKVLVIAKTRTIWGEDGKWHRGLACTDKALRMDVLLTSDCDYHIEETEEYKFGLIDKDETGDYKGTIIFMAEDEEDMEQLASLYLIRLAGAIRNGLGEEWRVEGTALCLANAALVINERAVGLGYVDERQTYVGNIRRGETYEPAIYDGNQEAEIEIRYIENKFAHILDET